MGDKMKDIIMKLRLDRYHSVVVLNEPESYHMFESLKYQDFLEGTPDLVFVYVYSLLEMKEYIERIYPYLQEKGRIYFAYPKKGNKLYEEYIHRDHIFPYLGVQDDGYLKDVMIKFVRMVALDEVYTVVGLEKVSR